jgi:glycerol-3-phosphate acyltransferase PlsY
MDIAGAAIVAVVAYLLGSISFARLLTARLGKAAVTEVEEMTVQLPGVDEPFRLSAMGGNTASMKLGARGGCAVGLLDMLKVFIPTLALRLIYPGQYLHLVAAVMGIVGHNWPIFYRFRGGRGISPLYGGLLAIDPLGAISVNLISIVLGLLILRNPVVIYLGGVILLIPWMAIVWRDWGYVLYALAACAVFLIAMIPEFQQMAAFQRKYPNIDPIAAFEVFPMGKQMTRMMDRLGLRKK